MVSHPLATNHGLQRIRIRFDLGIDRLDISHARAFAHRIDRRQSRSRIAFGLPVQRLGVVQQDLGIAEQRPRYGGPVGLRGPGILAVESRILELEGQITRQRIVEVARRLARVASVVELDRGDRIRTADPIPDLQVKPNL